MNVNDMEAIDSSTISNRHYDPELQVMYLRFRNKNGTPGEKCYRYKNITPALWEDALAFVSPRTGEASFGSWFELTIKRNQKAYPFSVVGDEEVETVTTDFASGEPIPVATESSLAVIETFTAVELFKPGAMEFVVSKIEAEVRATPRDISTEKGRKAIASLAYKVARSATYIEEKRLELVSDEKKRLAVIDAEGKKGRDRLTSLKLEARQSLTDWENEEKDRVARHEGSISAMELAGTLDFGASIEDIQSRIAILELVDLSTFQEFKERATQTKTSVLSALQTKLKIAEKQESDRIEMEKLRAEAEDRARKDREDQIAAEAREKAQREAEAERSRIEQEKFAAEARAKQAEAEKIAAEKKADADRLAEAERVTLQRIHDEKLHKEAIEAADRKAERDALAAVEAEKARVAAEVKRVADEAKARERDKAHKTTINNQALEALVLHSELSPADAKQVIVAIAKGLIPNIKISY